MDRLRRGLRRRPRLLPLLALGGLTAAALAALLAIVGGVAAARWARPSDRPVAAPLADAPVAVGDDVRLVAHGAGEVGGPERAPRIRWTAGALDVDVTPQQGVDLRVVTREAEVRVIGTAFRVDRDALGTAVDVVHGRVEVRCVAGGEHVLGAGEHTVCLPSTPPGLLGRANELKRRGADPAEVLATVDAALPAAAGPFLAELLALRAEALLALDRPAEARAAADRYLDAGGARTVDLLQIAATAALADGGCAAALPYLQRLEAQGAGDPERLARCEDQP
ncbi:MAG: FecR domain-containing protein [Myxococcota bacterium]